MTAAGERQAMRVGALRPNQLLHTYGVGAMADQPNLSVVMLGLDFWDLQHATYVREDRLLAAVRAKLGPQVGALRTPPYLPEGPDPFAEWSRVGVPVSLFPTWLRCTDCNRLGRADFGFFELLPHAFRTDLIRYVHPCRGRGPNRPIAVPARFVLACEEGHLDDFPWQYYVHRGNEPESGHSLKMTERGSTGEAANVFVTCDECGSQRSMSEAFGDAAALSLPLCRGRHPHLGTFEPCGLPTRTLGLGATNSWFPLQLRAFTLPHDDDPLRDLIARYWRELELYASLDERTAKGLIPTHNRWPDLEQYGVDAVWRKIRDRATTTGTGQRRQDGPNETDLRAPEWAAWTSKDPVSLPDFTAVRERVPDAGRPWLEDVVLVPRLREVAALYGFTRIDAPEWEPQSTPDVRCASLASAPPTWVPCAELRGEGIFLRFSENALSAWEHGAAVRDRVRRILLPAHVTWCERRRVDASNWPGLRYVLLHTFAHALIRELALDSGYSAAGIGERIYARSGDEPMAGVLLYTAAPDSEGTLGGLVSLGRSGRLGPLIERALEVATLCSSDPLCAEHDPRVHGRLYGAACHVCLFAAETSCERGNQYLDRALLVDTLATTGCGFFTPESRR